MNSWRRAGVICFSIVLLAGVGFADDKKDDKTADSNRPAPTVATSPAAAQLDSTSAAPVAPVQPSGATAPGTTPQSAVGAGTNSLTVAQPPAAPNAPASDDMEEAPTEWNPMPALSGNPGLFTLETGDLLPKGAYNLSFGTNKVSRMPGDITALETGPSFGIGLTDWLSASLQFDANTHIHVDEPSELSLNAVNAGNNQYGNTIYPSVIPAFGFPPGYVEDFPFASHNGGGVGELDLGVKIGLLSERRGHHLSLSLRNDFYIPTQTSLSDLLANQVQYGKFNYGIGLEASKHLLGNTMLATVNWSYRFTRASTYTVNLGGTQSTETLNLSDQMQVGVGLLMFPTKRYQIISEYSGLIFVGNGIPNTTFGARDPVDNVTGLRLYLLKQFALDLGYRYDLNLTNHLDRNGFVIKLSVARWPEKAEKPASPDNVVAACSVDKPAVTSGSGDVVIASAHATDSYGHPLSYVWTATSGTIVGSGPAARWDSTGAAPGSYSLVVRVDDGMGRTATCSTSVTVQ
jgi:hypothetical protein